jgi:hypothetical protein
VVPAQLVNTRWMHGMEPRDEDVSLMFHSSRGEVRIEGETLRPPSSRRGSPWGASSRRACPSIRTSSKGLPVTLGTAKRPFGNIERSCLP